ncbi:SsgA family sporulation/cell division regulator [Streptomyces termitum]
MSQLPAPRTLTRHLPMELLAPDAAVPIDTTVDYTSRDPHALSVAFHLGDGDPVVWRLDREMVLAGACAPTGLGDVHVLPVDGGRVLLRLGPVGLHAAVLCASDPLTDLAHETYALVPRGEEERHIDWRPLLAALRG